MNEMQNNFNPLMTKVVRVPMRHTFTVEQKMTLLRYFENGMFGQSMAYHDKIIQCAQESGLDFEVVKNWVGNQRRKRRMEEMQSVCIGQEHMMGPISPQSASKHPRMVGSPTGLHRQSQVLYFPRSSDAPLNLQGKPVNTSLCQDSSPHIHIRDVENRHMQYSPQFTQAPSVESVHRVNMNHPHMSHHNPETSRLQVPLSPPPPSQPTPRDFQATRSIPSSSSIPSAHSPHMIMNNKCRFVVQQSPSSVTSAPINSLQQSSSGTHHSQDPTIVHHQSGNLHHVSLTHTGSGSGAASYTTPQIGEVSQDGQYYFSEAPSHRSPRYQPVSNMDPGQNGEIFEEENEVEWRESQIQKIMETIQIYVDQLSKLGCEAFLASVSKDNFDTYLCGTPVGNNYFTKVNKDLPLSEFIEKQLRSRAGTTEAQAANGEEVNVSAEDNDDEEEEEEKVTAEEDASREERAETVEKEEKVQTKMNGQDENKEEAQRVIREGEEIYIVNKENFIIGRGTLLSGPFQKVTPKTAPKEDNAEEEEDGFIEDKSS